MAHTHTLLLARRILLVLSILQCLLLVVVQGDLGTATSYSPPYTPTRCYGSKQDQFPAGNLFVAVSEGLWDNGAACGRRYRLKCLSGGRSNPCNPGTTVDVRVVDLCTKRPCPSTVVLSNDAFRVISHSAKTKINIEYIQI